MTQLLTPIPATAAPEYEPETPPIQPGLDSLRTYLEATISNLRLASNNLESLIETTATNEEPPLTPDERITTRRQLDRILDDQRSLITNIKSLNGYLNRRYPSCSADAADVPRAHPPPRSGPSEFQRAVQWALNHDNVIRPKDLAEHMLAQRVSDRSVTSLTSSLTARITGSHRFRRISRGHYRLITR